MPNTIGQPTTQDVLKKLRIIAPNGVTQKNSEDVAEIIQAVIAEFQGPVGIDGMGGTGRTFTPVTEMRVFSGNGRYELYVDDIVPGTPITVLVGGATLQNVVLKASSRGLGHNVLTRQGGMPAGPGWSYMQTTGFPSGVQNVEVTAIWGFAATWPVDVYEAVRCEAAYRAIIQAEVGLDGVGQSVSIGDFEVNTSVGVSAWDKSSPIPLLHRTYTEAIRRYRVSEIWRVKALAGRMS